MAQAFGEIVAALFLNHPCLDVIDVVIKLAGRRPAKEILDAPDEFDGAPLDTVWSRHRLVQTWCGSDIVLSRHIVVQI